MMSVEKSGGTFAARRTLAGYDGIHYFALDAATAIDGADVARLPISLKVLLENLLRNEDGRTVKRGDIAALVRWPASRKSDREVSFHPGRVLMPDSSGTPLIVDLSAMRDAVKVQGGDPERVNPIIPVDIVLDHSVIAEYSGSPDSFDDNITLEFQRNKERYAFLRWAQNAYRNIRVVPPGRGIVHQINIEYLARPVRTEIGQNGVIAFPDTLVGMDSHTPMVNALGVFGWGVGGIEAASAMLGEPISMLIPEVVGCKLVGKLREGVTSTDLTLTVVQRLRAFGVIGKLVEFYGSALDDLKLPDRASLANMAPEYGATMGFFPFDSETLRYLHETGREAEEIALTEVYAKTQGLWRSEEERIYTDVLEIDLAVVETSLAGPCRPHDRVPLAEVPRNFAAAFPERKHSATSDMAIHDPARALQDGDLVIAAIASCTNTSNPSVMLRAGLLARNARARGLRTKPWVKTTLSPGSQTVTDYFAKAEIQQSLYELGFHLTGYGCMTCSGASGSLRPEIAAAIAANNLTVATVVSGNRNFEGRIHRAAKANYLASPPLIVAYAIAGSILINLRKDPLGYDDQARPVFLADIWPSNDEVRTAVAQSLSPEMFRDRYRYVFEGGDEWKTLNTKAAPTFHWDENSTYILRPPFFDEPGKPASMADEIVGARVLVMVGDNITTDHISPASEIPESSVAGRYLSSCGVARTEFNTYLTRRGNHEVMARGTFANERLQNEMVAVRGGITRHWPDGAEMTVFDAAQRYIGDAVPLVVIAGREYGAGSSRDWAAKGPAMLGVRAVIAESFERIHRSNLVGMGVLPLEFIKGETRFTLGLTGHETIDLAGLTGEPGFIANARIRRADGSVIEVKLRARIDTQIEAEWFANGGILPFVARKLLGGTVAAV